MNHQINRSIRSYYFCFVFEWWTSSRSFLRNPSTERADLLNVWVDRGVAQVSQMYSSSLGNALVVVVFLLSSRLSRQLSKPLFTLFFSCFDKVAVEPLKHIAIVFFCEAVFDTLKSFGLVFCRGNCRAFQNFQVFNSSTRHSAKLFFSVIVTYYFVAGFCINYQISNSMRGRLTWMGTLTVLIQESFASCKHLQKTSWVLSIWFEGAYDLMKRSLFLYCIQINY